MPTIRPTRRLTAAALAGLLLVAACARKGGCTGDYCGTLVIATGGEPDVLLPVVSDRAITRDVTDQLFLKLADLGLSGNTVGDEDFQPLLAERWEWDTPTTLVFHLDPRARRRRPVPVRGVAGGRESRALGRLHVLPRPSPPPAPHLAFHARPAGRRDSADRGRRRCGGGPGHTGQRAASLCRRHARVLPVQGIRVRVRRLQPRCPGRLDQAPPAVRRPRAAAGPLHD